MVCVGPQVTLEDLRAGERDQEEPTGMLALSQRRGKIGANAGGIIFTASSRDSSPSLSGRFRNQSVLVSTREETVGPSWSPAGSCLSGHTFQKVK